MKKIKNLLFVLSFLVVSCGCPNLINDTSDEYSSYKTTDEIKDSSKKESVEKDNVSTKSDLKVIKDEKKSKINNEEKIEFIKTDEKINEDTEISIADDTETSEIISEIETEDEEIEKKDIETEEIKEIETENIPNIFEDEKYKIKGFELSYVFKNFDDNVELINYNIMYNNQQCFVKKISHDYTIESIRLHYSYLEIDGYTECDLYLYHIDDTIAFYYSLYDYNKPNINYVNFENNTLIINTNSL